MGHNDCEGFFMYRYKHVHTKEMTKTQIHRVSLNFPQKNGAGYVLRALTVLRKILP